MGGRAIAAICLSSSGTLKPGASCWYVDWVGSTGRGRGGAGRASMHVGRHVARQRGNGARALLNHLQCHGIPLTSWRGGASWREGCGTVETSAEKTLQTRSLAHMSSPGCTRAPVQKHRAFHAASPTPRHTGSRTLSHPSLSQPHTYSGRAKILCPILPPHDTCAVRSQPPGAPRLIWPG